MNKFDREHEIFTRYEHNKDNPSGLSHNDVKVIYEDHYGDLWIGTSGGGLNKFDRKTGKFERCMINTITTDKEHFIHNDVRAIYEDRSGVLWIGTKGGLNRFDRNEEKFKCFREDDGLCNNVIYGILEDHQGNLWLSTNKGLSKFNPKTGTFKNYDFDDGLQGNEFNTGAYNLENKLNELKTVLQDLIDNDEEIHAYFDEKSSLLFR